MRELILTCGEAHFIFFLLLFRSVYKQAYTKTCPKTLLGEVLRSKKAELFHEIERSRQQ